MVPKMISVIRQLVNVNVKMDILLRHVMNVKKDILDSLIVKVKIIQICIKIIQIIQIKNIINL